MPESQPTVHGKRPTGTLAPRAFGVEDRPPCPSCGAAMHLFRRSPEPVYHGYEVQMFSCTKCDAEITRTAARSRRGLLPHARRSVAMPAAPAGLVPYPRKKYERQDI